MSGPSPELLSYLDALPEPHVVIGAGRRIVAANAAYVRTFARDTPVVGRTCHEVSHHRDAPCDEAGESCPLARARESGRGERVFHLHHTPDGEDHVEIELVAPRADGGLEPWFVEKIVSRRVERAKAGADGLIGRSAAFRRVLELVARVGRSDASILLLGESGTGKELVARAIHAASARADLPLVVVDCASLPETLFESEVFGHERGAFTGANASRPGLVEAATGGTLFIDEVGDIPPTIQVKLLRLLESGTYRRVGSTELRHSDVRVIAATHRDMNAMVRDGDFREDLYYRLCTFPIRLPALRERGDDVGLLADALLARLSGARPMTLSADAHSLLAAYPFPGNVRQLRNVLERAMLLCDVDVIGRDHVARALEAEPLVARVPAPQAARAPAAEGEGPARTRRAIDARSLAEAIEASQGNRADTARRLGVSERTLYRKLRALRAPR